MPDDLDARYAEKLQLKASEHCALCADEKSPSPCGDCVDFADGSPRWCGRWLRQPEKPAQVTILG